MNDVLPQHFPEQVWHVVFGPARAPVPVKPGLTWLAQWLVHRQHSNWQHCWAFTVTPAGWLVIYPGLDGLAVFEVDAGLLDRLKAEPPRRVIVLRVNESRPGAFRLNLTCARTVAALVGARGFRGLLPRQLCRYLVNHHQAEIVHGRVVRS